MTSKQSLDVQNVASFDWVVLHLILKYFENTTFGSLTIIYIKRVGFLVSICEFALFCLF